MKRAVKLYLLAILAFLLAGCVAPPKKSELIPSQVATYSTTGNSILIAPVIVRPQPKPGFLMDEPPRLDGEVFRQAIVDTLKKTNLFSAVQTEGEADYTLSVDVIGQRQLGTLSNVELLLVRYNLLDEASKQEVWAANLFSHFELSAEQVFMGIERSRQVLEGASRANITQLGEQLGNVLAGRRR